MAFTLTQAWIYERCLHQHETKQRENVSFVLLNNIDWWWLISCEKKNSLPLPWWNYQFLPSKKEREIIKVSWFLITNYKLVIDGIRYCAELTWVLKVAIISLYLSMTLSRLRSTRMDLGGSSSLLGATDTKYTLHYIALSYCLGMHQNWQ